MLSLFQTLNAYAPKKKHFQKISQKVKNLLLSISINLCLNLTEISKSSKLKPPYWAARTGRQASITAQITPSPTLPRPSTQIWVGRRSGLLLYSGLLFDCRFHGKFTFWMLLGIAENVHWHREVFFNRTVSERRSDSYWKGSWDAVGLLLLELLEMTERP